MLQDVGLPTEERLKELNKEYNSHLFEFMRSIDKNTNSESMLSFYKSFGGVSFKLLMYGLDLSIRSLPAKVLKLTFACFEGKFINAELVCS